MYHILVNPASRSGQGMKIWKEIEPLLLKKGVRYEVYFSKKPGDVAAHTKKLSALNQKITLIILGGDGTVNEALHGMKPLSNFTVGYIPTGSSNDLARDLKIPKDPAAALELILNGGSVKEMDIGLLEYELDEEPPAVKYHNVDGTKKRKFIVSCGIGFDAAVCAEAMSSPIKDTFNRLGLGKLTYLGIALKQLITTPKVPCRLWIDEEEEPIFLKRFFLIAAMNHRYQGGGFMFCPNADYTDGKFDICAVGNLPKLLVLFALPTAFWGKHFIFKGVDCYHARSLQIETEAPLWVHTDGEVKTKARRISLSQYKERLKMII